MTSVRVAMYFSQRQGKGQRGSEQIHILLVASSIYIYIYIRMTAALLPISSQFAKLARGVMA